MGAIATYLIGLMLLGTTLTVQEDLNTIMKIAASLMIVVFLVPLTLHQLYPDNYAEKFILSTIGMFLPITGLLVVPDLIRQIQVPGITGEILAQIDLLLYGVVLFAIGTVGYRLATMYRNRG